MSFITKRDRVFNEYELFDLPTRNEGKLKAYASCTDARAWSHFCSDKTEHLVEIIKRNNEIVRHKYIPTNVIVETLMFSKNAEISRLKQKIEEFEQLLAAYDQLDLSCDQKCEIANAHAAIRAANKELDEMCLDLDLSGYTEVLDSEAFETGKSGGDGDEEQEAYQIKPKTETKSVQMGISCTCNVGTHIRDRRIDEMQDIIICKDAKLNAMKNTIAGMENDLCEPYCIYANIYTALEKIFAVLCQNDKYRQYLKLLIAGKDIRCIGIKGKILFKLKVLEMFCGALIAPCSRDFPNPNPTYESACYRSEVNETSFAITSVEIIKNNSDSKRAHLVADIIQNEEMKEILSKESISDKNKEDFSYDFCDNIIDDYNIDTENLARLKKLQENYDDLSTCYESLKYEKENLENRCHKYEELEKEFEQFKLQIQEYNSLWSEKEHYRKRSMDLDTLKEQYLILTDETVNLETQLKAQTEINHVKCTSIEELRQENLILEKKLNEALIGFEKEKNSLVCKLNEADCRIMCQAQQIKSLSLQIDRLLEQDQQTVNLREVEENSIALIGELESHKDQIKNLKDALFYNDEEKESLQQQYQHQLKLVNEVKIEIEDWKSAYEKTLQRNDYLEKYAESLMKEIKDLSRNTEEKSLKLENMINVIDSKSQEISKLTSEVDNKKSENRILMQQINEMRNNFEQNILIIQNEKVDALNSLQIAKEESRRLMDKINTYNQMLASTSKTVLQFSEIQDIKNEIQAQFTNLEDKNLDMDVSIRQSSNSILLKEIEDLHKVNKFVTDHINNLQEENKLHKTSLELMQKESGQLKLKCNNFENLALQLQNLQISHNKLIKEKENLQQELVEKRYKLDNVIHNMQINKCKSEELIFKLQQSESAKNELMRLNEAYKQLTDEKCTLKEDLLAKETEIQKMTQSLNITKNCNDHLTQKCKYLDKLEKELQESKITINSILSEKTALENDFNYKNKEINNLYNTLEKKIEENQDYDKQIKYLKMRQLEAKTSIKTLEDDKVTTQARLNVIEKESAALIDKMKYYEALEIKFFQLKKSYDLMASEKEKIQNELNMQLTDLKRMAKENLELHKHSETLMSHSQDLENALLISRTEHLKNNPTPNESYKDVLKDIEEMKRERLMNQKKIRDLLDKLEELENINSDLSEDVMARDDRIVILQNHINKLQDEVKELQNNLNKIIVTGEQIRDFNIQNIKSITNMEAHHSKATHNMKMEIAQLHHQNIKLKEQLSVTEIESEKSSQNNILNISKLNHLEKERDKIVTDIKQLEIQTVGNSNLTPIKCDLQDILLSIERIRNSFNIRNSKTSSLEKTISKVKTSSELLLSKADEAKRLVEKEKRKIISEKEDAIKDKQKMEKQLLEFKDKLENQIARDQIIIKDLEASLSNQKLIFDKIKNNTEEYIAKLKDELQTLKDLYHNAIEKVSELQTKVHDLSKENDQLKLLEKVKENFDIKSKEVCLLQKELENIKNKSVNSIGIQIKPDSNNFDAETQIDKETLHNDKMELYCHNKIRSYNDKKIKPAFDIEYKSAFNTNIKSKSVFNTNIKSKSQNEPHTQENQPQLNEVQILTANVEPTFDYERCSYNGYDLPPSSTNKLQSSVSDISANKSKHYLTTEKSHSDLKNHSLTNNLLHIQNSQSFHTNPFKENGSTTHLEFNKEKQDPDTFIQIALSDPNDNEKYIDNSVIEASTLPKSSEKEKGLFIIYKDSQNTFNNIDYDKVTGIKPASTDITDNLEESLKCTDYMQIQLDNSFYSEDEENERSREFRNKDKLNIEILRVDIEGNSHITVSDSSKKSLNSYTVGQYSINTKPVSISDTRIVDNNKGNAPSLTTISVEESLSRDENVKNHCIDCEISRSKVLDTDSGTSKNLYKIWKKRDNTSSNSLKKPVHDLKTNKLQLRNDKNIKFSRKLSKHNNQDFALQYILNSVQGELDLNKTENFTLQIPAIESDNVFGTAHIGNDDFAISKLNDYNNCKLITMSKNEGSNQKTKTFSEIGTMANLDTNVEYENKIKSLAKALENIEKDYKKKLEAIKIQYDNNIKSIIKEHDQGVKSLQSIHEDALQDIIQTHENEVENLRSMSIEAMRKADLLKKENRELKTIVQDRGSFTLEEEPTKTSHEEKKRKKRRGQTKLLTKTTVEAFNVKPKLRSQGPCTCSLDINVSDTIRNIFEQVDVEQRKMAEYTYMKYVANKILNGDIEKLDAQELSFLHLKVCRIWKNKLNKEEALQKRIDNLETDLINKQRNTQQHIAELDRKVAEERRRLQKVREAVCRNAAQSFSRPCSPESILGRPLPCQSPGNDCTTNCNCNTTCNLKISSRGSAGDLAYANFGNRSQPQTTNEERRGKHVYNDEPPTRLRRSHDRQMRLKK